ncbi:CYTH domain-containing protein [Synechococcales cyanobacterium C]|uniref:CYTH domain-containing protein n=1 Tax=Petrachloros mirabilis ULC683 TaxID=2781853 RepID=A0A8K2A055_9CYAN|nr:CYTH domain-containing protein [Petrachloros mirabilis]NCJ07007.1 CYTH domain-containing protein [Petrachloros mirabilis ULC683]
MSIEIERKFLVTGQGWRSDHQGTSYLQGYLGLSSHCTVRVRIAGGCAWLTLKGKSQGISRSEYEYGIPIGEAQEILSTLCPGWIVEKTRYRVPWGGLIWEVDEFQGRNQGLLLAEVELSDPDQSVSLPDWVGMEVSQDRRYYNSYLAQHPYQTWTAEDRLANHLTR